MAIETPERERAAVLSQACCGNTELLQEVQRLVLSDGGGSGLLDNPVLGPRGPMALVCPHCQTCFDAGPDRCPLDDAALEPAFAGSLLIDGRYRVEKRLGKGGMGAVYRVLHIGLDKRFALKMIECGPVQSERTRERFRREGQALGRLKHRNIVDVTDAGVDSGGRPYLAMELLEGSSLQAELRQEGPFTIARTLELMRAIAAAMDFAHRNNVLHGDIKPGNIFLPSGGGVKILDFGLAELLDTQREQGPAMGTPAYMQPGTLWGDAVSDASDRYALAVLAYELLTGEVPFGRSAVEVLERSANPLAGMGGRNPSVPVEFDSIIGGELKQPSGTALDFVTSLEAAWQSACFRQWLKREVPIRCGMACLLALIMLLPAGWLAETSLMRIAEVRTRDARMRLRPDRAPDPRLLLVSIDDATLAAEPAPLTARADEAGQRLERVFAGPPAAVGIDLVLPAQWSLSPDFQKLILRHQRNLRLALLSGGQGETAGAESISLMTAGTLGRDSVGSLFAFVNMEIDPSGAPDGAVRRARFSYRDLNGARRPSLAAAVLGQNQSSEDLFWIDPSIRWQDLERLSWKDIAQANPERFRGRIVFVGAEFAGSGDEAHGIPERAGRRAEISGLALQGLIAATILEGAPLHDLSWAWILMRRWLLFVLPAVAMLCAPRIVPGAAAALGITFVSVAIDLTVFHFHALFQPMAAEYATLTVLLGLAWLIRSKRPRTMPE